MSNLNSASVPQPACKSILVFIPPPSLQAGCDALLSCNKQVELRSSVEDHNVYHCVLDAMKKHGEDPYLAGKAVDTLASLSSTGWWDN